MRLPTVVRLGLPLLAVAASPLRAETTECTVIDTIPYVITEQGVYCFKNHLPTDISSGAAIYIATNNVVIDLNGYKLGGLAAGPETGAIGILASERKNITIRNGSIRGFQIGVSRAEAT